MNNLDSVNHPPFAFLAPFPGGVDISILVQPRASRSQLVGEHGGRLKIKLAAPPVDGAANEALVKFLSDTLKLPRRQITMATGLASRRKVVRIQGLQLDELNSIIARALA